MNTRSRLVLALSAATLCFGLAFVPAASAMDDMNKGAMSKTDTMGKSDSMGKMDNMGKSDATKKPAKNTKTTAKKKTEGKSDGMSKMDHDMSGGMAK